MTRVRVLPFGSSLDFSPSAGGNVDFGVANALKISVFTYEAWVKLSAVGGVRDIMGYSGGSGPKLRFSAGNGLQFVKDGVAVIANGAAVVKNETWTHVALTYDANGVANLYVNGALDSSTTSLTSFTFTTSFKVGFVSNQFYGKIDRVRVFATALNAQQIANLYYFGKVQTTNPPGPVGQWLFNEGSGTTALDSSGNGNNGTITGATYSTDVPIVARTALTTKRLSVQDFKSSLLYPRGGTTATTTVKSGRILQGLSSYSIGAWVKPTVGNGANGAIYSERAASGNDILKFESVATSGGVLRLTLRDDAGTLNQLGADAGTGVKDGKWHYVMVTNKAGTVQFYVDGVLVGGGFQSTTNTYTDAGTSCRIGSDIADSLATWDGNIADVVLFNVALSPAEVITMSKTGNLVTYNPVGRWRLNEGAGTSATDYSGNGNTGTISVATYSGDVPTVARKLVNPNLTKNGGFDFVPPFTAATNTSARWIDGTAAGSTTNDIFGWGTYSEYACTFNYDTTTTKTGYASMKIATQAAAPTANHQNSVNQWPVSQTAVTAAKYLMPVVAGASYLITGYIKTDTITNNNARGARFNATTYSGDTSGSTSQGATTFVNGTTDWTYYSTVITISAGRSWLSVSPEIRGESGTAWFDKLEIYPVTAPARLSA